MDIHSEISREIPRGIPPRFLTGGTPILTAFGCALLERETGSGFMYTAVNLTSGRTEVLSRRLNPLAPSGVSAIAEKMRRSTVAGAGRFDVERAYGANIGIRCARDILNVVFKKLLPQHGYAVRREQVDLASQILHDIGDRRVSLAEAEVGTGKTLAYLVAAVIVKRGRLNDHGNRALYPEMGCAEMAYMPIVVATSSIALQKAILTDYIPELSRILMKNGIIQSPLMAVMRKGREHYVCERALRAHIPFENDRAMRYILENLLMKSAPIDLAETDGLTAHIKRVISVPGRCAENCPHRENCAYLRFRRRAQSPKIDIQVCNHNYLLADALNRAQNLRPLIPNYQVLVIDEAHKFLAAARSMYGTEFSGAVLPEVLRGVDALNFGCESTRKAVRTTAKKLANESKRLFRRLIDGVERSGTDDNPDRYSVSVDVAAAKHLRNIRNISDELREMLSATNTIGNGDGLKAQLVWKLSQVRDQTAALAKHGELICWLENDDSEQQLCAIPKDLDARLYAELWSRGIPTILTSGTLSAGGDFSHIRRTLGLDNLGNRLTETTKPSPFNHRENALLYISETVPFPESRDCGYIAALTGEIERLIRASHGHAAVLFTSYDAMGRVYAALTALRLPFPMFRLERSNSRAVERFKASGNGILFASGAMWEGVDIPGDALSMLIIVKLPFAVPDPIGEYERTQYSGMGEYKSRVVVPEMLVKLKQGFGRLIRNESDTGVVAILDSRVNGHGAYRDSVLDALPDCRVTDSVSEVESFYGAKKPPSYFN
ncbi:MAG: ATP-dependent DNA helicase [Oscillospiraceae bacterium]|nr:ATP-dependent DNA helicase [Oscillospiraceae bacterium]